MSFSVPHYWTWSWKSWERVSPVTIRDCISSHRYINNLYFVWKEYSSCAKIELQDKTNIGLVQNTKETVNNK